MFAKSFAIVFAAAAVVSVSALGIETPASLTQCGSVDITWSGKKAPFTLSVLPSCGSNSDDPILELAPVNATTYKWTVNVPSSTGAIAFAITDAEGNEAYSDEVTIGKSDDAACLNAAASSSSASGSASVTASVTGSASSVAATEVPRTTLTVSSSSAASPSAPVNIGGSAGSGSSSSSSNDNTQSSSAVAHVASMFAGVVGLATGLLALF